MNLARHKRIGKRRSQLAALNNGAVDLSREILGNAILCGAEGVLFGDYVDAHVRGIPIGGILCEDVAAHRLELRQDVRAVV